MERCKNCGRPIVRRDKDNVMKGLIDNYYIHDREIIKPFRNCVDEEKSTRRNIHFLQDENKKTIIAEKEIHHDHEDGLMGVS